LKGMHRPLAPASAHCASLLQMPGPPLPPKLQPPGGGVVEHCASFGRWLTGTRSPPLELPEEPPPLELPPEDAPPLLLLEEAPPPEEVEPPLLDAPLLELPPELDDELLPSLPASPGKPRTLPPQAQRQPSATSRPSARRRMKEPPVTRLSNCGATAQLACFEEVVRATLCRGLASAPGRSERMLSARVHGQSRRSSGVSAAFVGQGGIVYREVTGSNRCAGDAEADFMFEQCTQ